MQVQIDPLGLKIAQKFDEILQAATKTVDRPCGDHIELAPGDSLEQRIELGPPFPSLRSADPAIKPASGGNGPLRLTPLELLDRLAALMPPPRVHRDRYFGALAPNPPLRSAVTTLARAATTSESVTVP